MSKERGCSVCSMPLSQCKPRLAEKAAAQLRKDKAANVQLRLF